LGEQTKSPTCNLVLPGVDGTHLVDFSVGEEDCSSDGESDGTGDDAADGDEDGSAVGEEDCISDGEGDGTGNGAVDGAGDGSVVGEEDCRSDGEGDGSTVQSTSPEDETTWGMPSLPRRKEAPFPPVSVNHNSCLLELLITNLPLYWSVICTPSLEQQVPADQRRRL